MPQGVVKIPVWLVTIIVVTFISSLIALQVWTVQEISALKVQVAQLTTRLNAQGNHNIASK